MRDTEWLGEETGGIEQCTKGQLYCVEGILRDHMSHMSCSKASERL